MSLAKLKPLRSNIRCRYQKPVCYQRRYKPDETTPVSPRAGGIGHAIESDFAVIRENYGTFLRAVAPE